MNVFDFDSISLCDDFILRSLNSNDIEKGFCELLSQLTKCPKPEKKNFEMRIQRMKETNNYCIVVVEDEKKKKIVGAATLLLELKIIRNLNVVGHIEDVVTDKEIRGKGFGKKIISALLAVAKQRQCYKVILDAADSNAVFYEKCGFVRKEIQFRHNLNDDDDDDDVAPLDDAVNGAPSSSSTTPAAAIESSSSSTATD